MTRGPSLRAMEIAAALVLIAMGALAVQDSLRVGAGWSSDGPRSGYFPLILGIILILASIGNLVSALAMRDAAPFATWAQLRLVGSVLLPTTLYVAVIPLAGIYLPSALLIAFFMARFGGFRWSVSLASGALAAVVTFVIFEIWFLVALPKGPLEDALGF
ncbi:MAG: tripartite tricarboxylate transporter TctB family protein [Pseudomonadota bacterium]